MVVEMYADRGRMRNEICGSPIGDALGDFLEVRTSAVLSRRMNELLDGPNATHTSALDWRGHGWTASSRTVPMTCSKRRWPTLWMRSPQSIGARPLRDIIQEMRMATLEELYLYGEIAATSPASSGS